MAAEVPGDDAFAAAFVETEPSKAISSYFLNCFDAACEEKDAPHLAIDDPKVADREHIMPENPDSNYWPGLTKDDHDRLKDRLGNHALLTPAENKARANGGYDSARKSYAGSSFLTTQEIAN